MPSYPGGVGLTIGIPSDAKPVCLEWAFSLMNLHAPTNYDIRWAMVKGKPVDQARTMIVESALREKAKYLFFLGTDVTVPPFAVRQLIFHLEHYPQFAVAGAVYCHKSPPQEPLVYRGNGRGPYWDWKVGEVFDVSGIGMDATLIRMDVFKNLPKPWFSTTDDVSPYYEGEQKAEHWTEDLYFCHKITKRCYKCGLEKGEHEDKTDHSFSEWRILADGGLLCQHWDNMRGIAYSLPLNSKPYERMFPKGPKKVVDLGCGAMEDSYKTNEGQVIRVDIREEVQPDYRCDLRSLPFANEYFDVVFSSHTLEHFPKMEVPKVLDEMVRIMKADGEMRLVLPNIEWAARHIVNQEIDIDVMNVLYGAQTYEENFHKMGFTPKIVEQLLTERGFIKFDWAHENYHMMVRAWRVVPKEMPVMNPVIGFKEVEVGTEAQKEPEMTKVARSGDIAEFAGGESQGTVQIVVDPQPMVQDGMLVGAAENLS